MPVERRRTRVPGDPRHSSHHRPGRRAVGDSAAMVPTLQLCNTAGVCVRCTWAGSQGARGAASEGRRAEQERVVSPCRAALFCWAGVLYSRGRRVAMAAELAAGTTWVH